KLSKSTWKNDLMKSSKTLGRKTETKKERLMRAAIEEKLGMTRTDTDVRLFVSERDADEVGMDGESFLNRNVVDAPAQSAGKRKRNKKNKKNSESLEDADLDKQPNQDVDMGIDGTRDEEGHIETMTVDFEQREPVTAESLKRSLDQIVAGSALASTTIVKRKRQKKGR
ncbi:hypothetical protein LPJ57_009993, partial [Coemansia sp. RSA 486]